MEIRHLMLQWGLMSEKTPPPQIFPELQSEMEQAQAKVRQEVQNGRPRPPFPFQEQAKKLMETSHANTFVVGYQYFQNGEFHGHALLAVKRDDGSILYVDLQAVPPSIRDDLDLHHSCVWVIPSDVDWRSNRQLSNVVENGVHVPPTIGEPSN
jgi:hypothetical protein